MKTLEQELEEFALRCSFEGTESQQIRRAFVDGYERGHEAASKHCLSSIAKALTPPKGFLE